MRKKVLIGSPIHQKPAILKYFLESLSRLNIDNIDLYYLFIDDNEIQKSKDLLIDFSQKESNVNIIESGRDERYICNDITHQWKESLIWKVASYKNSMIQIASENNCDYLFLIDSDLVLHPYTLQQLISSGKDIISNIFWTKWQPNFPELPQVWMFDTYEQYSKKRGESLSQEEKNHRHRLYIETLRKPGIYEVGGLGACTLISKEAIKKGVNFSEIKNLSFWGEDRHFCVRAQALGLDLFVDTHFPSFHIYRESDLNEVDNYVMNTNTITTSQTANNIITSTIKGIEGLGSTYDPGNNIWISYFSEELLRIINKDLSEQKDHDSFVKAEVCDVVISKLENHQNIAIVEHLLVNKGFTNHEDFYEKLLCETTLIRRNNTWFINEINIKEALNSNMDDSNKQENVSSKKISLVYTNSSGSNSLALFKNMPNEIRETHYVELIKQENTLEFYKKIISSDVVVTTEGNFVLDKHLKHQNQKVIDLWHGFPLKAMGYADKSDTLISRIGKTWRNIDYISSYSTLFSEKMNECIKTDSEKYQVTGAPRNDLMLRKTGKKYLSFLFNKEMENKKLLLYMPTFRISPMKNVDEGNRNWENLFDINPFDTEKFQDFLKQNNIELIAKVHPTEESYLFNTIKEFNYINLLTDNMLEKSGLDLYEILGGIDMLITDYSSVYFDYLLLNRPIIFIPSDLERYSKTRGFLFDYERMTPGPKITSQLELQKEISNYLLQPMYYETERNNIKELIHYYKDDQSSKRVWNLICKI